MKFDKRYKVYTWKSWMMLHWIINPGLVINELFLGQRVPKITLEDTISDKPRLERSFVPCPHCNEIHDSRIWSTQNKTAFKNWFGLYCKNCGGIIPCFMNATSFIFLLVTYPIWGWFKETLKARWLEKQPERFENIKIESIVNPYEGQGWIKQGLFFGAFMFVFMTFLFPLFDGTTITWRDVLIGIPVWALGGLGFGYTMKLFMGKKGKEAV